MRNTLHEQIEKTFNNLIADIHTVVVAKITKIKRAEGLISCKPVIARVVNSETIPMPEFPDVPIITLQGDKHYISFPVVVGDYCLLFVSERCFDAWYEGQDDSEPLDPRKFDYSDCFALVGVNPRAKALPISNENETIITSKSGDYIKIIDNNKIEIKTAGDLTATVGGKLDANVTGKATIKANTIDIDGGTGATGGIVTTDCLCPIMLQPHMVGSLTVKCSR